MIPNSVRPTAAKRFSRRPPRPRATGLAFRQIVRANGGVEEGMIDAFLEGVPAERLDALRAEFAIPDLIERARKLLGRADQAMRHGPTEQRKKLRGISATMVALAADQAYQLDDLNERYVIAVDDCARAKEIRRHAVARSATLLDQATSVFKKVYVANDDVRTAIELDVAAILNEPNPSIRLVEALTTLAIIGNRMLREGNAAVKARSVLYGLDAGYLQTLGDMSTRLEELEEEIQGGERVLAVKETIERVHGVTAFLLHQIAEAFDAAHAAEPNVQAFVLPEDESMRPKKRPVTPGKGPAPGLRTTTGIRIARVVGR